LNVLLFVSAASIWIALNGLELAFTVNWSPCSTPDNVTLPSELFVMVTVCGDPAVITLTEIGASTVSPPPPDTVTGPAPSPMKI